MLKNAKYSLDKFLCFQISSQIFSRFKFFGFRPALNWIKKLNNQLTPFLIRFFDLILLYFNCVAHFTAFLLQTNILNCIRNKGNVFNWQKRRLENLNEMKWNETKVLIVWILIWKKSGRHFKQNFQVISVSLSSILYHKIGQKVLKNFVNLLILHIQAHNYNTWNNIPEVYLQE